MNTRPGQDHYYAEIAFEGYVKRSRQSPNGVPTDWNTLTFDQKEGFLGAAIAILDFERARHDAKLGGVPVRAQSETTYREETTARLVLLETKLLEIGNAYNELTAAHNRLKKEVAAYTTFEGIATRTAERFDLFQTSQNIVNTRIVDSLDKLNERCDEIEDQRNEDAKVNDSDAAEALEELRTHAIIAYDEGQASMEEIDALYKRVSDALPVEDSEEHDESTDEGRINRGKHEDNLIALRQLLNAWYRASGEQEKMYERTAIRLMRKIAPQKS